MKMKLDAESPRPKRNRRPEDRWTTQLHDWLISPAGRLLRYAIVLMIIMVAVVGSLNRWFELCETVTSAKEGITTTCAGPDLTSAGVLAATLLVLLLLWPDLSEFSAFGVTVKRLVLDVKERVIDSGAATRRIESRTAGTHASIQQLRSLVEVGDSGLSQKLDGITTSLLYLREQEARSQANETLPATLNRWYVEDRERLVFLGQLLFGEEQIYERSLALRLGTRDQHLEEFGTFEGSGRLRAQRVGMLIEMYRRSNMIAFDTERGVERANRTDEVMRLVERLLLTYIDGRPASVDSPIDAMFDATVILSLINDR